MAETWRLDTAPSPITNLGKKNGPVYMKILLKGGANAQGRESELLIIEHHDGKLGLAVYDLDSTFVFQKTEPSKLPFNVFEFLMKEMPEFKDWFATQEARPSK